MRKRRLSENQEMGEGKGIFARLGGGETLEVFLRRSR
jgi:hypothetical protein